MALRIKKQERKVVYVGELMAPKEERTVTVQALGIAIQAVERKEITMQPEHLSALRELQKCVLDIRPRDKEKE